MDARAADACYKPICLRTARHTLDRFDRRLYHEWSSVNVSVVAARIAFDKWHTRVVFPRYVPSCEFLNERLV